ncbi:Peptidase M23 [Chlorobaculum parvum NCIB 8327]|uniref:Peptidase M23 n=2 Tax=Chlorobaculum parvum TaxID=274539 RepID=B3QM49_CHLP8|nr:Peptidase M23 [Chlorobaculum parvum NCIB 8327]
MFSCRRFLAVLFNLLYTTLFLVSALSLFPLSARAASAEMNKILKERKQVERTLSDLKKQLGEYQSKLKSTKKNEARSVADLKNIRKQILVYERLIKENQNLLTGLDQEIDALQQELAENRKNYHHVSSDFQRIAIAAYKRGGNRNAELIFSSHSVNDVVVRSRYVGFLSQAVRSKVGELQSSAQQMEASRARLQQSYQEKEKAMKSQQVELQGYASKKKEKEAVLTSLKKDKRTYANRIAGVRKKQRQMQQKIEALIMAQQELIRKEREAALRRQRLAEERRRAAAQKSGKKVTQPARGPVDFTEEELKRVSANFDAGSSLPWPVKNGVVVRKFGSSRDKELNIVTVSNGIDISVPAGTPVRSVSGGKVVQVAFLPTFGNVVIVRHPKSYLTVYANLTKVSVTAGEVIQSRQLLGSSAAMPEGGSTVHFEIWKGKVKQDPQKWLR